MKILRNEVARIVNLVLHVLEFKQELLARHKIDQIIVCSIAGVLSINRSRSNYSLDEIFKHYNSLMHSYNSNRHMLFDSEGNRIDLVDFYNSIFLPNKIWLTSTTQSFYPTSTRSSTRKKMPLRS